MISITITASDGSTVNLRIADPTVLSGVATESGAMLMTENNNQVITE